MRHRGPPVPGPSAGPHKDPSPRPELSSSHLLPLFSLLALHRVFVNTPRSHLFRIPRAFARTLTTGSTTTSQEASNMSGSAYRVLPMWRHAQLGWCSQCIAQSISSSSRTTFLNPRLTSISTKSTQMVRVVCFASAVLGAPSLYYSVFSSAGGNVGQRYDSVLKVSQLTAQRSRARAQHAHEAVIITQGFSAQIPESYLQRLQAFQGSVIDYIGRQSLFSLTKRHPCFDVSARCSPHPSSGCLDPR